MDSGAPRRSARGLSLAGTFGTAAILLAATGCEGQQHGSGGGLAAGMALFSQHDLDGAEAALAAMPADASLLDRASALQARALISWRFRLEWDRAEGLLREALELEGGRSPTWAALARLETARGRYDEGREAALRAIDEAETSSESLVATIRLAEAAVSRAEDRVDQSPLDRLESDTIERLRESHEKLRTAVGDNPGDLGTARLYLRASILLGDGDGLFDGWRSYYLTIVEKPDAGVLDGPRQTLDALLPGWGNRAPTPAEVGRVVLALARSGMHREAWLAARTPAWTQGVEPADPETEEGATSLAETLVYARFVQEGAALTDEFYRRTALGEADTDGYRAEFLGLAEPLWAALDWNGDPPRLTLASLIREVDRRFDAQMRGGQTAGYADLHFGHRVIDEHISVSQYGHEADLRFVALDGMVSNGFQSWAWDYRAQHGGWAGSNGITQVRPAYAGGGQEIWRRLSDSLAFRRASEETARETERDWERAAVDPHAFLPGLKGRLAMQGVERLLAALRAEGPEETLERRFLVASDAAIFASSIVAHEGRHAIDKRLGSFPSAELEFRAKLSEIAFAPHPRIAFGGILSGNIGDGTPHGQANLRVMEGLVAWLELHGDEVPGFDVSRPLLPQLDLLSDHQLRAAMASMDPLAR